MTAELIGTRLTAQPDPVRRKETGELHRAMYYRRDRTNQPQIEAWLMDALITADNGVLGVAGALGEIRLCPGEFLVLGAGFMAFRDDEFHDRFDIRVGEP